MGIIAKQCAGARKCQQDASSMSQYKVVTINRYARTGCLWILRKYRGDELRLPISQISMIHLFKPTYLWFAGEQVQSYALAQLVLAVPTNQVNYYPIRLR